MKVIFLTLFTILFMSGCSHKISITPSLDELRNVKVTNSANINVAYYISNEMKSLQVTTAGGAGEKINYTPYADIEVALKTILSKKFNQVYSLKSLNDKIYIQEKDIQYIFTTKIRTSSSSSNWALWAPTNFIFELTCNAINSKNNNVWKETVFSKGLADKDEMLLDSNGSLSAKRATDKAFKKMLKKLENTDVFNIKK